jgi:hypothetical protein
MLYMFSISLQITALIFAALSRKLVSGIISYQVFVTLPTALVLSLNIKTNNTISCSLLAIAVPVQEAVSGLKCVSLGKYAQMLYLMLNIVTVAALWLIFVKLDSWRVRGKGIFSCKAKKVSDKQYVGMYSFNIENRNPLI